jgi:hypothetical protein
MVNGFAEMGLGAGSGGKRCWHGSERFPGSKTPRASSRRWNTPDAAPCGGWQSRKGHCGFQGWPGREPLRRYSLRSSAYLRSDKEVRATVILGRNRIFCWLAAVRRSTSARFERAYWTAAPAAAGTSRISGGGARRSISAVTSAIIFRSWSPS